MKRIWRRIIRNLVGALLIAIGIVGGFIPILQGWLFIVAGLLLIDWPGRRWLLAKLRHTRLFQRSEQWCHRRFGFRFDPDEDDLPQTGPDSRAPSAAPLAGAPAAGPDARPPAEPVTPYPPASDQGCTGS